jgi:hypothetical protein
VNLDERNRLPNRSMTCTALVLLPEYTGLPSQLLYHGLLLEPAAPHRSDLRRFGKSSTYCTEVTMQEWFVLGTVSVV